MEKLKPLTKVTKKKKETKSKSKIKTYKDLELSLNININPKYKGYTGTIAELLYSMPKEVKSIFNNSTITSIKAGAGLLVVKLQ
jgi:hypothetical protein